MELPPRARRIPPFCRMLAQHPGTTSACAENTHRAAPCLPHSRNYLRVRGEYICAIFARTISAELPPRARRILGAGASLATSHGTTSACAENTTYCNTHHTIIWNYLRVRGEYPHRSGFALVFGELPPRARRIRHSAWEVPGRGGTTSACAENTFFRGHIGNIGQNYLRVRGEYRAALSWVWLSVELPPRARRIHINFDLGEAPVGTTSACAENTSPLRWGWPTRRNYLRVRGEYRPQRQPELLKAELPPRARRIPAGENQGG